jgi:predicted Zn-dependent protease
VVVGFALALAACSRDAADQAYFQALEGEKEGRPCEELLPLVDRAIALQPARVSYWQMRSGYRSGLGDLAGALSDIDQAITLHDRPYLRYSRAIVLCKSGRFSDALPDLDAAIAAQPDNLQFYRIRAIARAAVGKGALALEDGQLVVARMPQWAENFYARGVAWAALGRARAAVADFTVVLQTRPEIVYPLAARADAYAALGEAALAAADRAELARRSRGHGGCHGCGYCEDALHQ